jgi:hypothetical protein
VKEAIHAEGGLELILSTMEAHPKNQTVLEQGCAALAAVCLRNPANCTAVAAANGPHIIVKSMHMHPEAPSLLAMACSALRNLVARNPELRPLVLEEGAER